jgi:predicted P-loop ATPase
VETLKDKELSIRHDGEINLALGVSRRQKTWKNVVWLWSQFVSRCGKVQRTGETYAEYMRLARGVQDGIKDVGGFVGGFLTGGRRKSGCVANRQLITLDVDHAAGTSVWEAYKLIYGNAALCYSTHKHREGAARLRIVIPLDSPVFADQYEAVARAIAGNLGIESFDDSTFEPTRLMYWPSASSDGAWFFDYVDAEWMEGEEILASYADWRDSTSWPVSDRVEQRTLRDVKKAGDPLTKPWPIGEFNRTYDIASAISEFLPDVYEPTQDPSRYTYREGSTSAGLVIYDGVFAYSHHGTDPLTSRLVNAFDLVRLHKFGLMDEDTAPQTRMDRLPSYREMRAFAGGLEEIRLLAAAEDFAEEGDEAAPEDREKVRWAAALERDPQGRIKGTLPNLVHIFRHDPTLAGIRYDLFRDTLTIQGGKPVPWGREGPWAYKTDDPQCRVYLDTRYKTHFTKDAYEAAITASARERGYHPVREYLEGLPDWDGVPRVDTLLLDYLGAEDNAYTQAVIRKTLCAAIRRVLYPGCKFDYVLILAGPQGIGKSALFARLGGEWHNESLSLADLADSKAAQEKLQGSWIVEIPEMAGGRKVDVDKLKSFITTTNDAYRSAYARDVEHHKRQCILVGDVNDGEEGFLRDATGNRRFWPVRTPGKDPLAITQMPRDTVDQIWAEALIHEANGEPLYLDTETEKIAKDRQRNALVHDTREGSVEEFLNLSIPVDWLSMAIDELQDLYMVRENFEAEPNQSDKIGRLTQRDSVSIIEVWCCCFGRRASDITRKDSFEIKTILARLGWEPAGKNRRIRDYGMVKLYTKGGQKK